jgi:hypothetical protein
MFENATAEQRTEQRKILGRPFPPGTSGNLSGRRAQQERAAREELERRAEVAALVAGFGRELNAFERDLLDEYAALTIEARRLRRLGKSTLDVARVKSRIAAQLGLRRDVAIKRQALEAPPTALDRYRAELDAGASRSAPVPFDAAMAPMSVEECLGRPPESSSAGAMLAQTAANPPGEACAGADRPSDGYRP